MLKPYEPNLVFFCSSSSSSLPCQRNELIQPLPRIPRLTTRTSTTVTTRKRHHHSLTFGMIVELSICFSSCPHQAIITPKTLVRGRVEIFHYDTFASLQNAPGIEILENVLVRCGCWISSFQILSDCSSTKILETLVSHYKCPKTTVFFKRSTRTTNSN